jgi:hypothetical protein
LRRANPSAVYEIRPVSFYRPGGPLPTPEASSTNNQDGAPQDAR